MAEIRIERKKQVWLWLLAGFVIAALLVYFLGFRNNRNETKIVIEETYINGTNDKNLLGVKENNSTVEAFVRFMKSNNSEMELNSAFTNEALVQLTAATNAMAGEIGYDIQADLNKVKESAKLVANEPFETSNAKNIRNAADSSNKALQHMQLAKYPWLTEEVEELKSASASINPEEQTLGQNDAVKNYFAKAADILQKMN